MLWRVTWRVFPCRRLMKCRPISGVFYDAIVTGLAAAGWSGPLARHRTARNWRKKWQQLGELLRYRTSLPARCSSELAILVTAWHCQSNLEWHDPRANGGRGESAEPGDRSGLRSGIRPRRRSIPISDTVVFDWARALNKRVAKVKASRYTSAPRSARREWYCGAYRADWLLHDGRHDVERSTKFRCPKAQRRNSPSSAELEIPTAPRS